ncbi:MAG: phosphoribosylglycinamide formyltransferase [Rhizobiaceae bacterium]|jgi:phosphoribosylglycinamide formyltransferase-1|nr:phosphoribosylglycinamide formyltransferase [Rhizobiaceae bacterium]
MKTPVAILISGRGSNMEKLVEAARAPDHPAEICGVLADRADAAGLDFARGQGLVAVAVERKGFADKAAHEAAISAVLADWGAGFIALAGFMRVLSPEFVQAWHGRIVNIHPSLLPRHKGLDTHARALAAGDTEHGCSVHWVTAELDGGDVIAQARVPVLSGDTVATLSARVLAEEHKLYPAALAQALRHHQTMTGD